MAAEVAVAARDDSDAMPAENSLERPGTKSPVVIPTDALGVLSSLRHRPMQGDCVLLSWVIMHWSLDLIDTTAANRLYRSLMWHTREYEPADAATMLCIWLLWHCARHSKVWALCCRVLSAEMALQSDISWLLCAGDAISAYMIIRAFSWQLRLSPVAFEEFAAALFASHPSPLLDEVGKAS